MIGDLVTFFELWIKVFAFLTGFGASGEGWFEGVVVDVEGYGWDVED